MLIQGVVGQQQLLDGASPQIARMGRQGEIINSKLHSDHYEQAYRGNIFTGANQAAVTTSVAFATTYTGLCLSNPLASNKNLVLNRASVAISVAFAAASVIGLMGSSSVTNVTHTTPVTPYSSIVGGGIAPNGRVDSAATLPATPVLLDILAGGLTGAITTAPAVQIFADYQGSIIIPPGGFVAFYTSTASGASGFSGSFEWEEVPV